VSERHPDWCYLARCTASEQSGAHRGQPAIVENVVLSLYSDAANPSVVLVEIRAGTGILAARVAYAVGRTLTALAKQANSGGAR